MTAPAARKARSICMIAYTNYAIDARVRREAETLASVGFRVSCFTNRNQGTATRYVLNGVEVRELAVPKYRGKSTVAYILSYLRFLASATIACLGRLAKGEIDVVHVHNLPDFLVFAAVLPRLVGKKVVLDIHDSVPETFATKFSGNPALHKALCLEERVCAAVAHKVICVNHPQRDVLVSRGIPMAKTFVSMNVPDPRIFAAGPAVDRASNGHFNLVYHGTMAERLGVDLIIRAVAELRERIPCLTLHLWGGGDDLPAFQRLADELGVQDRVSFKPKGFPLDELPGRLGGMDLGVVGNRTNVATDLMLPVKLLEYVSLGIPAVVPRLRTIDHYFSEDMVSYFEPEDVSSLADAIHRMYCQPSVRRRQAATASRFLDQHGWHRQGSELVAMYNRLVEN
jgi:glycosyltransferase involved in cell wall biosynthesis